MSALAVPALEDGAADIIGKAQQGLELSDQDLARKAGLPLDELTRVKAGQWSDEAIRRLALALELGPDALIDIARSAWHPQVRGEIPGLTRFETACGHGLRVNVYLVTDPGSGNAVCFDTGTDASAIVRFAAEREIRVQLLLLTHTHSDHIADMRRLCLATGARAFVSKRESLHGAETFEDGHNFIVGNLRVEGRLTPGHSKGGTTYVISGLPRLLAVVGDALFAGSIGRGLVSYTDTVKNVCERILTLPEDAILCPGHGPLTTVRQEKLHNPFFPQFQAARVMKAA